MKPIHKYTKITYGENMKLHDLIQEGLMSFFSKKKDENSDKPSDFPDRNNVDEWMQDTVEYYKKKYPDSVWKLFCPSTADYLLSRIHAGLSRDTMLKHLKGYRELKSKYPSDAKKALANVVDYYIYSGGPSEDYPK